MQLDYNFTLLLFIFLRLSGCILFNPIFGRRNVPTTVKTGLSLILTIFTYGLLQNPQDVVATTVVAVVILGAKELLIGFIIGFIINLFMSALIVAGDVMDMQVGLSMSKIYDPASNVSMPVTASVINVMLMVIFFLSNGHLTLIQIFTYSADILPFGAFTITPDVYKSIALLFQTVLIYAVKLSMPILAAEIITEMGVGLMMKAVPQINVFVVNIQLKVLIGLLMMVLLVPAFAGFVERLLTVMFDNIAGFLAVLS